MNLGEQIKKRRTELNITQEELANRLNVTRAAVSNWEREKNYPDLQTIVCISDELNISLDILLKGDRKMVEKITQDIKENPQLKKKNKILMAMLVILSLCCIAFALFFNYLNEESYIPYDELGAKATEGGDLYVKQKFYKQYTLVEGEKKDIGVIFFTKRNGENTKASGVVDNFTQYDEKFKAVYYLPEKYVIKYNLQDGDLLDFCPTQSELEEIKSEGKLVWQRNN